MFQSPGNVFIEIFNFPIYYYSICLALAILSGCWVSCQFTKKYYPYLDADAFFDTLLYIVGFAIVFSRIYYVVVDWGYYSNHLSEIFMVWKGGLTIHGAILGGAIGGFVRTLMDKRLDFLSYADVTPWGILVGQIIGRWGNFFNSEAFGLPTDLPWKLYIAPQFRPEGYENFAYFHPTFLYESIWNIFVFLILFFVFRKLMKNIRGGVLFVYLIFYSVGRILIESIRTDTIAFVHGIPVPTLVSAFTILIAICGIIYSWVNREKITQFDARKITK